MAARCASVGAWESAADTISNEAPASDAKNIDARFNLSITWNHLSVFARRTIEQPRNQIRSKFNGRKNSAAGIIFPFRTARKPILPTTDDGSLTPASNLDHSLAAIFAGEQSDQCLRRILQPIDHVLLDLELAGGDP